MLARLYVLTALLCAIGALFILAGNAACQDITAVNSDVYTRPTTSTRSVRLNNYNILFGAENPTDDANKLQVLARRDCIKISELDECAEFNCETIRSLHPDADLYRLYALIIKPTWDSDWSNPSDTSKMQCPLTRAEIDRHNWWLRDGEGNIVKESEYQPYLDPGKTGFKEAYLQAVLSRNTGKGFKGFVFDIWCPSIINSWFPPGTGGWFNTHSVPAAYADDTYWYVTGWQPFITYLAAGLHKAGYRIIGNCAGEYNTGRVAEDWQRTQVEGVIYEQFAVDWAASGGGWLPGSVIERRINSFRLDPLEAWASDDGVRGDDPLYDQKQTLSLGMYYIAIPMSQSQRTYNHYRNHWIYWLPIWDLNIGVPAELPVKRTGMYFWSRKFTKGVVLLNYETSRSQTFFLSGKYKDVNGKLWSGTVSLAPHTAMILAKS